MRRIKVIEPILALIVAFGLVGCTVSEADALMNSATIITNGENHWFITLQKDGVTWYINGQVMVEQGFLQAGTDSPWAIRSTADRLIRHGYQYGTWAAVPGVLKEMILAELVNVPQFVPVPFLAVPLMPADIFPTATPRLPL